MDTWKPVAMVSDISPDTGTLRVMHEGEGVCLYNLQGDICATQDRCPHGNASLADGYLEDGTIECPLHQASSTSVPASRNARRSRRTCAATRCGWSRAPST